MGDTGTVAVGIYRCLCKNEFWIIKENDEDLKHNQRHVQNALVRRN